MAASSIDDARGGARVGSRALLFASVAVIAAFAATGGGIAILGKPDVGEPVVRFSLKPPPRVVPKSVQTAQAAPPADGTIAPAIPAAPPPQAGEPTVPKNVVPNTVTRPIVAGRALVADPALIEQTADGPLPRIADSGRTPMEAYAAPAPGGTQPKIALLIAGLGFSARETSAALAQLPPQVTLAFAPYSDDTQRWVGEARRLGHEVLLEVPMEPYDFPDSDPGPHTLRSGVDEESNTQRLVWALTRFTGYTGITNLLGSRFMADQDSLSPVMTFLTRRGLMFYDNGSVSRSLAPQVARRTGTPFVQSSVTIDRIQTAMEIDRRLSELEVRARATGSAGGTGFVYPVTMERVALWAQGLSGRGFVLVPASAIVTKPN